MPPVGFEPTISAGERPQTYALDRAATGTGSVDIDRLYMCRHLPVRKYTCLKPAPLHVYCPNLRNVESFNNLVSSDKPPPTSQR